MSGSSPEPDVVTRSTGPAPFAPFGFSVCTEAVTRVGSAVFVGARFEPLEADASYPLPAPAAEGRDQKYPGPSNACPISFEPTTTPLRVISEPSACFGNSTCANPVTTSG